MPRIQWDDPFRDLLSLQERMNRLFEDSLARTATPEEEQPVGTWWPAVDILEKEREIILKAELPGLALEEVDLQIQDDILVMRGERHFDQETKKENYHRVERAYGAFSRSFKLTTIIDKSRIKAKLKDGILEVKLPKIVKLRSRPIPIAPKGS
jgi:HSP20 family protein